MTRRTHVYFHCYKLGNPTAAVTKSAHARWLQSRSGGQTLVEKHRNHSANSSSEAAITSMPANSQAVTNDWLLS